VCSYQLYVGAAAAVEAVAAAAAIVDVLACVLDSHNKSTALLSSCHHYDADLMLPYKLHKPVNLRV
jgi:hypothetical protein